MKRRKIYKLCLDEVTQCARSLYSQYMNGGELCDYDAGCNYGKIDCMINTLNRLDERVEWGWIRTNDGIDVYTNKPEIKRVFCKAIGKDDDVLWKHYQNMIAKLEME